MTTDYHEFLARKTLRAESHGRTPRDTSSVLYPFQRTIVEWAIRKGRAAIFADCGLGKTLMQLEWARQCGAGGKTLIVAPLAVAEQTIAEADKLAMTVERVTAPTDAPFQITNYQRLRAFVGADYQAIVLDESSILKSLDGKTRTLLLSEFTRPQYRLACTATPAPNDIAELGNHSEFVGALPRVEMLASFFVHDEQTWRLRGHARDAFWKWCASWSCYVRRPSDLGFPDDGFVLPPLEIRDEVVASDYRPEKSLFSLGGIHERREARRQSIEGRAARTAEMIAESDGQWLVWCDLNDEGDAIESLVPGAIQVKGADDDDWKIAAVRWFQGARCICDDPIFAKRLSAWRETPNINGNTTPPTESDGSRSRSPMGASTGSNGPSTCPNTIGRSQRSSSAPPSNSAPSTPDEESNTRPIPRSAKSSSRRRSNGGRPTLTRGLPSECVGTDSPLPTITGCSRSKEGAAPSAPAPTQGVAPGRASTSITVIGPGASEGSCAATAIPGSASSQTTPADSSARPCICGHRTGRRVLICKPSMFGFGLNLQNCHRMAFLGLGDSYERYYQAIRRCWRFGQAQPVECVVVLGSTEGSVAANVRRKEAGSERTAAGVVEHMREAMADEMGVNAGRQRQEYVENVARGDGWELRLGDCVERIREIPDASVGLSVFSPPFASLYTYSASDRDMGNAGTFDQFYRHFDYLIPELLRVTMPGRRACVHVQQISTTKATHGVIGWRDFRAECVQHFVAAGWVYDGEVVIDKDPQAQAIRTRSKALLFVQKNKDSSWSRPAMADYILLFRHPGDNPVPIVPDVSNEEWICWARPIWYGIRESDTLQAAEARDPDDERHICPLQLETIERCVRLWSNPGELVLSPFAGIGSEGVVSVRKGRRFTGIELKPGYWKVATKNLQGCNRQVGLFDALAG